MVDEDMRSIYILDVRSCKAVSVDVLESSFVFLTLGSLSPVQLYTHYLTRIILSLLDDPQHEPEQSTNLNTECF